MKLTGRDASRYFAQPDPKRAGLLIFGADAMRVALRRQEVISALIGPEGDAEMRLTRLQAGDLRRDAAAVHDAVKAQGFFPGPRVVFVEDATDTITDALAAALTDWAAGDAHIVVTGGALKATSKLRKLFEGARTTVAIGLYDDPPSREEVEATLRDAGLRDITPDALSDLLELSRNLDPGDFRQTVQKIALYKYRDDSPLTPAEVQVNAPLSQEADVDEILHAVAESRLTDIATLLARLQGQGVTPVSLCIGATRHFRTLHAACADPGGPGAGIAKLRPPVFGPRRDKMLKQAQDWGLPRLEDALSRLTETDLTLRSASRAPNMALIERTFIQLAMLARAKRR
ncbi:DNA polymerase III subunit delta [Roseicitreum antarcticum]|uniref:DNA-directed DNA polymerase n=1 Tax=Roseicitreum antarcticum TaxID=564137 RepID=A0A1H3AML7_9RHOB|nr:hypothetical protein [Roseicitreum antarcticum]SDX30394.1 DNA polymerase III, delta subunit [Roseicitreum antarcticum]